MFRFLCSKKAEVFLWDACVQVEVSTDVGNSINDASTITLTIGAFVDAIQTPFHEVRRPLAGRLLRFLISEQSHRLVRDMGLTVRSPCLRG